MRPGCGLDCVATARAEGSPLRVGRYGERCLPYLGPPDA